MTNRRSLLLGMLAAPLAIRFATAAPTVLRIGVAPHSSARVILQMYQPLRDFLAEHLGQPVEIVTAPDFTEFARRALASHYDIAITTGHQAYLLQSDARFLPLLTYQADFKALMVVAADSAYRQPADLAGTTVMGLSPSSLVTLWGMHWLHRNDVRGVQLRYVSASDSAVHQVLSREASAATVSLANFQNLKPEMREHLRVLAESLPLAGRVYLLAPRLARRRAQILDALWAFAATAEARAYFERYRLGGYRSIGDRELLEMAPYANEVRQALQGR